jgi:hypothetical protein
MRVFWSTLKVNSDFSKCFTFPWTCGLDWWPYLCHKSWSLKLRHGHVTVLVVPYSVQKSWTKPQDKRILLKNAFAHFTSLPLRIRLIIPTGSRIPVQLIWLETAFKRSRLWPNTFALKVETWKPPEASFWNRFSRRREKKPFRCTLCSFCLALVHKTVVEVWLSASASTLS